MRGIFWPNGFTSPGFTPSPYEGEEVKLHWANRDQYYIKTSEHLRDYAFALKPGATDDSMRVHFRLTEAAEGEHGNIKAGEDQNRVFILAKQDFLIEQDGESGRELVICFEYRPATLTDWSETAREKATEAVRKKPPGQQACGKMPCAAPANDSQREEWVRLHAIDEVQENIFAADYSEPLTPAF
jgi:adenine-specific DNA-methyltransferase